MDWFIPYSKLTPEQQKVVNFNTNANRVMYGGPGSGKTMILLHRAYYLHRAKRIPTDRIHIFVFNNTLLSFIQSGLQALGLDFSMASTLDKWCVQYYRNHIDSRLPRIDGEIDFNEIRCKTYERIETSNQLPVFDAVLVDEGQDLNEVCYKLLLRISHHITVACDYKQQIYEIKDTQDTLIKLLNARNSCISLSSLVRCTPKVANLAAGFIKKSREQDDFFKQVDLIERRDEIPLFQIVHNNSNESNHIMKTIRMRVNNNETIGIVFPTNRTLYGFVKAAKRKGIEIETPKEKDFSDQHNFNTSVPKAFTVFGIKGLTFDSVLIPYVKHRFYEEMKPERLMKSIFVAITRAKHWVYFSSVSEYFPNHEVFKQIIDAGFLKLNVLPSDQIEIFDETDDKERKRQEFDFSEETEDEVTDLL